MSDTSKDSKFSFIDTLIGAIAGSTSDFSGGRGRVNAQATQDIKNDAFERKLKQNQNASDRIIKDGKTDANKKIVELQKLSNENTNAISGQISKIDAKLNNTISRVSTIETGLGDLNRALKNLSKENGKDEFQKVTFANHEKRIKQLEKVNGISNANGSIFDLLGRMSKNKWLRLLGKGGIIGSALAAAGYLTYREFRARGQDREKDIDLIMKRLDSIQDPKSPAGRKAIADAARESKRVKQLSGMELRENKSKLIEQKKRIATKAREGGNVRFGAIQSIEAELDELQGKQMSSARRNAAVAQILRKNPGLKEQDLGPGYARQVDRARAWERKDIRKSKRNIRRGAYGTMDDEGEMYDDYGFDTDLSITDTNLPGTDLSYRNKNVSRLNEVDTYKLYQEGGWKAIEDHNIRKNIWKAAGIGRNTAASARKKWPGMSHLGSSVKNGRMPPLPTMSQSGTGLVKQRQQLTGMTAQQHQDYQEKKQFLKFGALPGGFEHVDGNRGILGKPMAVMAGGSQARGSGGGGGFGGAQARGSGGGGGPGGTTSSSGRASTGRSIQEQLDAVVMPSAPGKFGINSATRDQLTKDQRQSIPGKRNISLDFNSALNGRGGEIIIPDNATKEERAAAWAYLKGVQQVAKKYGYDNYKIRGVKTRSENGRGVGGFFHTEPFFAQDPKFKKLLTNPDFVKDLSRTTAKTLGSIDGATFIAAHKSSDYGATMTLADGTKINERDFSRNQLIPHIQKYRQELDEKDGFAKTGPASKSTTKHATIESLEKSFTQDHRDSAIGRAAKMGTTHGQQRGARRAVFRNNPGGIGGKTGISDKPWLKKYNTTADSDDVKFRNSQGTFAVAGFKTYEQGSAALLGHYKNSPYYKNKTLLEANHTWTGGKPYVARMKEVGLDPSMIINDKNLSNPEIAKKLVRFHMMGEASATGKEAQNIISDAQLEKAHEYFMLKEGLKTEKKATSSMSASALLNAEDKIYQEQVNGKKDFLTGNMAVARKQATGGSMADLIKRSSSTTGGSGVVNELQKDKASVRVHPISKKLKKALGYAAAKAGVEVDIWSGGQDEAGRRKLGSSKRHNHGNAADLDLYVTEGGKRRKLKSSNTKDRKLIASFIKHSAAAGAGGIGTGYGYMGDGRLHVGFGKQNTWGGGMTGDYAVAHKAGLALQGKVDLNNTGVGEQTILNDKSLWAQNEMNQMRSANAPPGVGPGMWGEEDSRIVSSLKNLLPNDDGSGSGGVLWGAKSDPTGMNGYDAEGLNADRDVIAAQRGFRKTPMNSPDAGKGYVYSGITPPQPPTAEIKRKTGTFGAAKPKKPPSWSQWFRSGVSGIVNTIGGVVQDIDRPIEQLNNRDGTGGVVTSDPTGMNGYAPVRSDRSESQQITDSMDNEAGLEIAVKEAEITKKEKKKKDDDSAPPPGGRGGNGGRRTPERSFPKAGDSGVGGSSKCWV